MKQKLTTIMKHMDAVAPPSKATSSTPRRPAWAATRRTLLKAIASAKVAFVEAVLGVLTAEQRPKLVAHLKAHAGELD